MLYDSAFFSRELDRRGTACEKWDGLEARIGHEMNPMWVADMDFSCPEEIRNALAERAAHPAYGYTDNSDSSVEALLSFMKRRHNLEISKEEQLMLPCVITGLRAALLTLTQPGDGVIISSPVYGPFRFSIEENDRKTVDCPLLADAQGYYTMNYELIESACRDGAKLMMLCNPHNPVGRCWKKEELVKLFNILRRYRVPLISDEIHEDFIMEGNCFTSALSLVTNADESVVTLTSASKTFNLAGLQQAVLFTRNAKLMEAFSKTMRRVGVVSGNIFAMVATEAAYRYGDAWLDGLLSYLKDGEALFRKELCHLLPKAILSPLEATYLGWIDLRAYGYNTEELVSRCRAQGVEFTPGTFFSREHGDGFLRINYACPHAHILKAAKQLAAAVKS